jgi:hypothetical protein
MRVYFRKLLYHFIFITIGLHTLLGTKEEVNLLVGHPIVLNLQPQEHQVIITISILLDILSNIQDKQALCLSI